MGRDRGRGKRGGRSGGRRSYIANIEELQLRETVQTDEDEEEEEEEEVAKDKSGGASGEADPDSVFRFRRAAKAAAAAADEVEEEEEEDDKPKGLLAGMERSNPNLIKKHDKMLKIKSLGADGEVVEEVDTTAGLSRREREELEAIRKKEEYMRRHLAGETEQARKDLERLALIKKRREDSRLKREAEGRKPGMSAYGLPDEDVVVSAGGAADDDDDDDDDSEDEAPKPSAKVVAAPEVAAKKKAAAAAVVETSSSSGPEKLKTIDIKKMNADALKEHLKARGLNTQGQKKDLMTRLIDYESARV